MEFFPKRNPYKLSPERREVEKELLKLARPNVGLHGTSTYRDQLIELAKSYDPEQTPDSVDAQYTYYSLIDPDRMKGKHIHPLFFSYTITLARTFAMKAVRTDAERGISSRPILRVMTNMHPETIIDDYRVDNKRKRSLIDFEAREDHHGLYERTVGKIDEIDYDFTVGVVDNDTRVLQQLVPILLRPLSPVQE